MARISQGPGYLGRFSQRCRRSTAASRCGGQVLRHTPLTLELCLPMPFGAIILGGLGFPRSWELRRSLRSPWADGHALTVATLVAVDAGRDGPFTAVDEGPIPRPSLTAPANKVLLGWLLPRGQHAHRVLRFPSGGAADRIAACYAHSCSSVVAAPAAGGIPRSPPSLFFGHAHPAELRGDRRVHAWARWIMRICRDRCTAGRGSRGHGYVVAPGNERHVAGRAPVRGRLRIGTGGTLHGSNEAVQNSVSWCWSC